MKERIWDCYPPSIYALSYNARLQGAGSTAIGITASESGEDYLVEVASATAEVTQLEPLGLPSHKIPDSQRIQIDSGEFEIKTNLASDTSDRTHSEKMVDYLESTLESLAQKLTTSYSVSDRSNTLTQWKMSETSSTTTKGK